MSYVLDFNPQFWNDVTVRAPGDGEVLGTFRARFRALDADQYARHELKTGAGTLAFLEEVLVDFSEVEAEDGSAVAFSGDGKAALLRAVPARLALVKSYHEAFVEAKAGN